MNDRTVYIHYRRPPDRERVFEQRWIEDLGECVVTLLEEAPQSVPVTVGGRVVLEPGAPIIWFSYPGRWYDIGRFHLADGTFTGIYANILTPVRMLGNRWDTTDLFLDVWMDDNGGITVLDREELEEAVERGWIDAATARAAKEQAEALAAAARAGDWPPAHVREWTLDRARSALRGKAPD